jgi:putative membrane protein
MTNHPMRRASLIGTALLASLLAAACTSVETTRSAAAPAAVTMGAASATSLSAADRQFALDAAGSGLYEVAAAQLALARAASPAVVNYAQMLIQHHTAANQQLLAIMGARGVAPPTSLPPDKQHNIEMFRPRSGPEFDRMFIEIAGVKDHQGAIGTFERASTTVSDPDLRAWAQNTLPVLREHYAAAQRIEVGPAG